MLLNILSLLSLTALAGTSIVCKNEGTKDSLPVEVELAKPETIKDVIKVTELGTLNSNESAVILMALGKVNNFDPFFNDWMFEVTDNTLNSAKVISFAFPNESVEVTFRVSTLN